MARARREPDDDIDRRGFIRTARRGTGRVETETQRGDGAESIMMGEGKVREQKPS